MSLQGSSEQPQGDRVGTHVGQLQEDKLRNNKKSTFLLLQGSPKWTGLYWKEIGSLPLSKKVWRTFYGSGKGLMQRPLPNEAPL